MPQEHYKSIFSNRLQQARAMAGLSLRELSDKIGGAVSHAALAKYENAEMMPDSSLLISLARALGQTPEFFFRPLETPISEVKFRAQEEKLGAKERQAITSKSQDYFARYLAVESLIGEVSEFHNPLGKTLLRQLEDLEDAAIKVREAWCLGNQPLGNLTALLESKSIKICELGMPDEADGFSGWIDETPVIVIAGHLNHNLLRKRHTLLHELGHLLLKDRIDRVLVEEKGMGRFAAALSLPKEEFIRTFGGHRHALSLEELIDLKAYWGISISSIVFRAKELGLISYAVSKRFWQEYGTAWKEKRAEPGDDRYQGTESSHRFHQLVHRAIAEGHVTRSRAAELLNKSLSEIRSHAEIVQ